MPAGGWMETGLVFLAYSVAGWLLQCVALVVGGGRSGRQAGLLEPLPAGLVCGVWALAGQALLRGLWGNWPGLFVAGALFGTALQLLAALVQRLLYGGVWWDYSHRPLSVGGVVCLEAVLSWGVAAMVLVWLHPWVAALPTMLAPGVVVMLFWAVAALYAVGLAVGVGAAARRRRRRGRRAVPKAPRAGHVAPVAAVPPQVHTQSRPPAKPQADSGRWEYKR